MMKKYIILIFSLTALLAVSSCGRAGAPNSIPYGDERHKEKNSNH